MPYSPAQRSAELGVGQFAGIPGRPRRRRVGDTPRHRKRRLAACRGRSIARTSPSCSRRSPGPRTASSLRFRSVAGVGRCQVLAQYTKPRSATPGSCGSERKPRSCRAASTFNNPAVSASTRPAASLHSSAQRGSYCPQRNTRVLPARRAPDESKSNRSRSFIRWRNRRASTCTAVVKTGPGLREGAGPRRS